MPYLPTGIETLDRLLGSRGFLRGTTILIRGPAGTGKTTLAFQIAANALRLIGEDVSVAFGAMEENADLALGRIYDSLEFRDQKPDPPSRFDPKVPTFNASGLGADWKTFQKTYPLFQTVDLLNFWETIVVGKGLDEALRMFTSRFGLDAGKGLDEALPKFTLRIGHDKSPARPSRPRTLVVIDSLNALVYGAQARLGNKVGERQVILALLRAFQHCWPDPNERPTVILTAEDASGTPMAPAESYLADTVIELSRGPVALRFPIREDDHWARQSVSHLFCRVTKARGLKNQNRASCYAFVAGSGLKFFPTYAAEGLVSLFAENTPQFAHISSFRSNDVASYYPGVQIQEFTISGAQRMFAVRRHAERIPPGQPLLLSNIDEYWVDVLRREGQLHAIPESALHLGSVAGSVIEPLRRKERSPGVPFYRADNGDFLAVPYMGNVGMLVYRKDVLREIGEEVPQTWEELREICLKLKGPAHQDRGLPYKFLIETQTYDTLMVTALELAWSDGNYWTTRENTKTKRMMVDLKGRTPRDFARPIEMLARMIHTDGIIPYSSCVDPGHVSGVDDEGVADWVFARHWYSTWVDVLTKRGPKGELLARFDEDAEFGVAPIPVTQRRLEECQARGEDCPHHSGWGEWYLAIQEGSENVEMGVDLINNLMTARKLSELAFNGAGLPVLEESYTIHGESVCPWIDVTFNDVRARFLEFAKTRTDFFDYRRVGRILYGALNSIVTNPSVVDRKSKVRVLNILKGSLQELGL